jgi:hypothetical protein
MSWIELIPLTIYRQFHRPSSDLIWACIEGMLVRPLHLSMPEFDLILRLKFKQFKVRIYRQLFGFHNA